MVAPVHGVPTSESGTEKQWHLGVDCSEHVCRPSALARSQSGQCTESEFAEHGARALGCTKPRLHSDCTEYEYAYTEHGPPHPGASAAKGGPDEKKANSRSVMYDRYEHADSVTRCSQCCAKALFSDQLRPSAIQRRESTQTAAPTW